MRRLFPLACLILLAGCYTQPRSEKLFNPDAVVVVTGTIEKIEQVTPKDGKDQIYFQLRQSKGHTLTVWVGPAWYYDNQNIQFKKGEEVTVTGSMANVDEKDLLVASEIDRDGLILRMRGDDGNPVWEGWRSATP